MNNVIFDSWNHYLEPRIWRQCSFAEWMDYCELMGTWEKSLRTMPYCDWTIHRKLGEAAGLAHRYIIPARGSGKSLFVDSFDDSKMILKKNKKEPKQEFVTIKDGDVERWLHEQIRMEHIERILDIFRENGDEEGQRRVITSHNPYWSLDPCWVEDSEGNLTIREVSYIPNYLWDKEVL